MQRNCDYTFLTFDASVIWMGMKKTKYKMSTKKTWKWLKKWLKNMKTGSTSKKQEKQEKTWEWKPCQSRTYGCPIKNVLCLWGYHKETTKGIKPKILETSSKKIKIHVFKKSKKYIGADD